MTPEDVTRLVDAIDRLTARVDELCDRSANIEEALARIADTLDTRGPRDAG